MTLLASIDPAYVLSGFLVGLLVGQVGVGGGSLMTPLLVLVFGVQPATAIGTDLLYAAVTKSVGAVVHGAHGTVDWRLTGRLALGSVPATILTLIVMAQFNPLDPATAVFISRMLGGLLVLTGIVLVLRPWLLAWLAPKVGRLPEHRIALLTVTTGAVLGVLVTASSIGAGALGVTALLLLYPGRSTVRIVGVDIAHAVPLTLVAGLGHWMVGSVDLRLLASLLTGSIPGIVLGSLLAVRLPDGILRPVLAATLLLVGGRLAM